MASLMWGMGFPCSSTEATGSHEKNQLWPCGSVGWSIVLHMKRLRVRSPVGAHTGGGATIRCVSLTSMFLSLSCSL